MMNFVYSSIRRYPTEVLLYLEEDYLLREDAFHLVQTILLPEIRKCEEQNPENICVGALADRFGYSDEKTPEQILENLWKSGNHNIGMVTTKRWFNEVRAHAKSFCEHDDYNWDYR